MGLGAGSLEKKSICEMKVKMSLEAVESVEAGNANKASSIIR